MSASELQTCWENFLEEVAEIFGRHHRRPKAPECVHLFISKRRKTMTPDATLAWQASPSDNVNSYLVTFTYNGAAQPSVSVPRTAAQDSGGYTLDFATSNPSLTVAAGDVIGAWIVAVDTADNLTSAAVTPPSVTEPTPPPPPPAAPLPPQNVTLTLS
jgi:hypothetical protein